MERLKQKLIKIDEKGYKAYKTLEGNYRFPAYSLIIDHVQGDPFAAPSRIRVRVDRSISGFPSDTTSSTIRAMALCDHLTRIFYTQCTKGARQDRGIGKSGLIVIDKPVQEVLNRTAMIINDRFVEARFFMGLPAYERKISSQNAIEMFFKEVPIIVHHSMILENMDHPQLYRAIETAEDANFIRTRLKEKNLTCFVADGSRLPRRSGIDSAPMDTKKVIPFKSPGAFQVRFDLPNYGTIKGMGIPEGITLIVGGGYHGKSTLIKAIELGVYNHVPGDGREFTVTIPEAVKIRAADGRSIVKTDVSPFISRLPFGKDTACFSTGNASGSTSQAANITEAVEAGARLLLLDEDTSATNFMIRDHRMQMLVSRDREPITPFIDKVRQLYSERNISTILVMGGSGDYFSVADHVIQMTEYRPYDVTNQAHHLAKTIVTGRINEGGEIFGAVRNRIPEKKGFDAHESHKKKISVFRTNEILLGNLKIDLWDMEQLVDISQTRALGHAIVYALKFIDGNRTLGEVADLLISSIDQNGLEIMLPFLTGDIAAFRRFEFIAAINRMRTLTVKQKQERDDQG